MVGLEILIVLKIDNNLAAKIELGRFQSRMMGLGSWHFWCFIPHVLRTLLLRNFCGKSRNGTEATDACDRSAADRAEQPQNYSCSAFCRARAPPCNDTLCIALTHTCHFLPQMSRCAGWVVFALPLSDVTNQHTAFERWVWVSESGILSHDGGAKCVDFQKTVISLGKFMHTHADDLIEALKLKSNRIR